MSRSLSFSSMLGDVSGDQKRLRTDLQPQRLLRYTIGSKKVDLVGSAQSECLGVIILRGIKVISENSDV